MQSYQSLYPNHVHQLIVSVSKHYWITSEGNLKFQRNKMDMTLDKVELSKKNHLIHYMIRDHYTGVVYSEVATSKSNIMLQHFLFRAWSQKNKYVFCGIPELLTIPNTVQKAFPEIKEKVSQLGIRFPKVVNGFQAGVRDIKTLEEFMKFYSGLSFIENHSALNQTYKYISNRKARNEELSKIELWDKNIDKILVPSELWLKT